MFALEKGKPKDICSSVDFDTALPSAARALHPGTTRIQAFILCHEPEAIQGHGPDHESRTKHRAHSDSSGSKPGLLKMRVNGLNGGQPSGACRPDPVPAVVPERLFNNEGLAGDLKFAENIAAQIRRKDPSAGHRGCNSTRESPTQKRTDLKAEKPAFFVMSWVGSHRRCFEFESIGLRRQYIVGPERVGTGRRNSVFRPRCRSVAAEGFSGTTWGSSLALRIKA